MFIATWFPTVLIKILKTDKNLVKKLKIDFLLNLWLFLHNFWARNARKPIKASKDLDYSLVSTKNLSQNFCSSSCGLGPDDLGQKGLNLSHYPNCDIINKKYKTQNFQN